MTEVTKFCVVIKSDDGENFRGSTTPPAVAKDFSDMNADAGCKGKRKWIYIAPLLKYLTLYALRYRSHSVTCKLHRTCLYLISIHQMAHPRLRLRTSNCSLLLIYLPQKDERLSWPEWLVT